MYVGLQCLALSGRGRWCTRARAHTRAPAVSQAPSGAAVASRVGRRRRRRRGRVSEPMDPTGSKARATMLSASALPCACCMPRVCESDSCQMHTAYAAEVSARPLGDVRHLDPRRRATWRPSGISMADARARWRSRVAHGTSTGPRTRGRSSEARGGAFTAQRDWPAPLGGGLSSMAVVARSWCPRF
jgi:hypothetical protein